MTLDIGTRLGDYEVTGSLGAGGMGEVYRAGDTKLGRDVALKVLPADFARDPERRVRFEREAKVLAGLNHPHIATLYGYEERDGNAFLAMELVEGEDLAARLKRGPIPVNESLPLFSQIAEGLEAAHERGIIHRDLKPANLIVSKDGRVKILDFGLAKALLPPDLGQTNISESPTITAAPTQHGQILGTAAYMSPEQARGDEVDQRTDVWSFGCVLYEALSGRRPFGGTNPSEVMASILKEDPDWGLLPDDTPKPVVRLLHRALAKDSSKRLRHMGDARLELDEAGLSAESDEEREQPLRRQKWMWPSVALAALTLFAFGWALRNWFAPPGGQGRPQVLHSSWPLEPGLRLSGGGLQENTASSRHRPTRTAIAASPDGQTLVFAASDGQSRLYRRDLDQALATAIPETEGAGSPFFSPDGQWIGFALTDSDSVSFSLWRIPVTGGSPRLLTKHHEGRHPAPPYGVSWGKGRVVYGTKTRLMMVSDQGGDASVLADPAPELGQQALRLPHFLPDGETLLYTVTRGSDWSKAEVWVRSISGGNPKRLLQDAADATYAASGHLLFGRQGRLMAAPFDLSALEVTAEPVGVIEGVVQAQYDTSTRRDTGAAQYASAPGGLLFYASGGVVTLVADPGLRVTPQGLISESGFTGYQTLISPDGTRIAFHRDGAIWIGDLKRGSEDVLPFEYVWAGWFTWSADSTRILFASDHEGPWSLYSRAADGSDEPILVLKTGKSLIPASWSKSGWITFLVDQEDIWVVKLTGQELGEPHEFASTDAREYFPRMSPDEKWIAYTSDKSGRDAIYIRAFPGPGPEKRVSIRGGVEPLWSKDSRRLYFRQGSSRERLMVAELIDPEQGRFDAPRPLFEAEGLSYTNPITAYSISEEGDFFFGARYAPEPEPATAIEILHDWQKRAFGRDNRDP